MKKKLIGAVLLLTMSTSALAFFNQPTIKDLMDKTLALSDDIGEMADRILVMADNIGVMSDRIVETEQIMVNLTEEIVLLNMQNNLSSSILI